MSFLFFVLAIMPVSSYANKPTKSCKHDQNNLRCVQYVKNYDGDTITFNIPQLHPLLGKKINIRVNGVDTPEIRTKNKCEKNKAHYAKKLVANLFKKAKRVDLENVKRGKYFRIVADVFIDNKSLTRYLLKSGLAYPYNGGKKRKVNWCNTYRTTASQNHTL